MVAAMALLAISSAGCLGVVASVVQRRRVAVSMPEVAVAD